MAQIHILEEDGFSSSVLGPRLVRSADVTAGRSTGDLTIDNTPQDFHDYTASSVETTPQHSPTLTVRRTSSLPGSRGGSSLVMSDRDKCIYNALGSSSGSAGKVGTNGCHTTLNLRNYV